jgi:hypothetical protein
MKNSNALGVSVADVAFSAGSLRVGLAYSAAPHPAPATAHAGTAAHAAMAAGAITPMRKRRIATATDAFVNRGST